VFGRSAVALLTLLVQLVLPLATFLLTVVVHKHG